VQTDQANSFFGFSVVSEHYILLQFTFWDRSTILCANYFESWSLDQGMYSTKPTVWWLFRSLIIHHTLSPPFAPLSRSQDGGFSYWQCRWNSCILHLGNLSLLSRPVSLSFSFGCRLAEEIWTWNGAPGTPSGTLSELLGATDIFAYNCRHLFCEHRSAFALHSCTAPRSLSLPCSCI